MMARGVALAVLLAAPGALAQTAAPPPGSPAPAPAIAPPAAETELIYRGEATSILGRTVRDGAGESIGRIVDVLVDEAGQPRAAVIDFGGFMGLGNRRVAVAWRALHFLPAAQRGQIRLELTADQIKAMPEYKRPTTPGDPPVSVAAPPPK